MSDYADWVEGLLRKTSRLGVVFVQLGAANEPARRALKGANVRVTEVTDYLESEPDDIRTVVIDCLERLLLPGRADLLAPLRERVFSEIDDGIRFILLSRAPKIAFPDVPGSSLLDDASFAHGPTFAGRFDSVPTCDVDGRSVDAVLRESLAELGPEVCASLDRVIFESMLLGTEALNSLVARELEALDGAGITTKGHGVRQWAFPRQLVSLKEALSSVLGSQHGAQPQLADVSSGLWTIERLLRSAVRDRACAAWGKQWKKQLLNPTLQAQVLDRARESAYLAATGIGQLRDPLEWLSLGELLQLRDNPTIGNLGLDAAIWRNFSVQVMPIRNRTAHMRNLHPRDAVDVLKWLRVLESRL